MKKYRTFLQYRVVVIIIHVRVYILLYTAVSESVVLRKEDRPSSVIYWPLKNLKIERGKKNDKKEV